MARSSLDNLDGMVISDLSIRQPVFITMLMVLAIVIGLLAYTTLPVNLLPDFEIPVVSVAVPYPGAGPESVAELVSKPVEKTLNTISGVNHITSNSSDGISQIIIEFENGVDVNRAEQDVREKINAVLPSLPRDIRDPVISKFDLNDAPIMQIAVAGNGSITPLELRRLVDDDVVPRLQQVQGVGSVDVNGGQVRQINVFMDLQKLQAYRILPVQITNAISNANNNTGLGTITQGTTDINLRAPSILQNPQDIARVQITGTPYRVGDIATIEDGVAEVKSYSRLDGQDAITIAVRKQSGTNTVQVADNVEEQLGELFSNRTDLTYYIPNNQATSVRSSTESSIEELLLAAVAAMLVVLLFFRDLRNTIVTIVGLPVIMIGTFAAMSVFGLTVNLITLLALSLSVGLVIDDAIVVRENIFRQMERGLSPRQASSRGTAQVALSVLAMTLTIIAVFLPVTFTSGTTGIIFKSFGIVVASAMAISLIEAFTLAPMLSAYFFKQRDIGRHGVKTFATPEEELIDEASEDHGRLSRAYGRLLATSLRRRWVVMLIAGVILGVSVVAATGLKFSFFPAQDSHQFLMGFELPPGSTLSETDALARQVEAIVKQDSDVDAVLATVGSTGSPERAEFFVKLKEKVPTPPTQERLRQELAPLNLPKLVFGQTSFSGSGTGIANRQIQLSLRTTRPIQELLPLAQQLQGTGQQVQGLVDVDTNYNPGKPEVRFYADPTKIGSLGVTNNDIASSVRALVNGDTATVYRKDGQDVDVVVRLEQGDRASTDDIRGITIPTAGGSVPLGSLARVEIATSPTTIRRYDLQNELLIGANVVGRNTNEVQREIQAGLDQIQIPPDVQVSFRGAAQQQQEGFTTLFVAMGLSVLFVYMVLASQFGSFLQPLVIMLAMPFSFLGAFVALLLTGIELDITGMIGLIMLLGLVTKNSILLVDFTNRLRSAGMPRNEAIATAGAVRLRPILMTTAAILVGSLPTAMGIHFLSSGEGSEFRRGLAVVLIGGLLTSTLLTLFVVPVAYSLLDSVISWFGRVFRRNKPADEPIQTVDVSNDGHSPAASDGATNGGHYTETYTTPVIEEQPKR